MVTIDDAMGVVAGGVSLAIIAKAAMLPIEVMEQNINKQSEKKTVKKTAKKKISKKNTLMPNVKTPNLDAFRVNIPKL